MSKRVLLANSSYFPSIGGVENSLVNLAREYVALGYEVVVVTKDREGLKSLYGETIVTYHNFPNLVMKLLKLRKMNDFEVVISRHHLLSFILSIFGIKNAYVVPGIVKYQNVHQLDLNFTSRTKYHAHCLLQKFALLKSSKVYVFSEIMKSQVLSIAKCPVEYLTPGVDTMRFSKAGIEKRNIFRETYKLQKTDKLILCLGRLSAVKGFDKAIESLNLLSEEYKLLLVGDGELKADLLNKIAENNLSERVIFIGRSNQPEYYYSISDLFCLPSIYEPFGQVLLEATASELKIVAYNSELTQVDTATSKIYSDFTSLISLANSFSSKGLADAIKESSFKDISHTELKAFCERYSWRAMAEALLSNSEPVVESTNV